MSTIVRMCDYLCNIRKEALLHRVVVLHTTQKITEFCSVVVVCLKVIPTILATAHPPNAPLTAFPALNLGKAQQKSRMIVSAVKATLLV